MLLSMIPQTDKYTKYAYPSCVTVAHESCWSNFQLKDTHIFPLFYSGQDGQHWNLRPMAFLQTKTTDFI